VTTRSARGTHFSARHLFFCLLLALAFSALSSHILPVVNAAPASKDLKPTDPYALIFGTVWGPDARPVYGVKVNIRRVTDKKPKWQLSSDHSGEFAQRIAAGKNDYIVGADLKGVKTTDGHRLRLVEEVPVHVEYDERVDIGLHLALEK
jgi:hypothetical protein